ncbi:thiolase family protein [Mycolicibacterium pyrenivorans]|uniref:thiolase family protein n=1 Tax=Mycolicibacterium pyrenivorans TaxID=187102 RepID=UPI0021F29839|nr:thiolase family protein [Mycolicibacterium pyrenivorans]MCV7152710.1 thiolase family protein [Mycolicibacterium pyrenivorans]
MSTAANEVAIIGVGLHPFGRFDKTAMEMGAEAIDLALADAGVEWKDIQFGFGGSYEVSNPDAVTRLVGLTGITFTNVFNACATSASAIQQTADTIRLGKYDIGIAIGMDKHPRGAFTDDPAKLALPQWYAENGQFVTTKFFGMKANHYIHKHGISPETLARVANKNFRNGALNPNAFRRKEIPVEEILNSTVLNYPLTQYMFCAPDEGAAAVIMCRGDLAHKFTDTPVFVRATEIRTRTYGAYEVHATSAPLDEDPSPTVFAAKAAYEAAGIGPEDVDIAQLQDTDAGAEVIHMAETGLCADGEQEKLLADGATEIHGTMPVNTDGGLIANGEPIGASGLRQVHELVRQLRGQAGDRQVPGSPRVGLAQVYGAPGTASATILSL